MYGKKDIGEKPSEIRYQY